MKHKFQWLFSVMMILGLALSACGGTANTAVNEPNVETNANMNENTMANNMVDEEPAVVVDVMPLAEGEKDLAVMDFLADMTAYNTIGLDALNEALVDNPPFLIDVRTPGEVEEKGHIEGAINISLRELPANISSLPSFDTPIVTYCGSGWRCTIALTVLETAGWEDVKCLKGGSYSGWVAAGYATVDGLPPAAEMLDAVQLDPAVVTWMEEALSNIPENWGGVSAEALNTTLVETPDLIVIDARTKGEVESKGHVAADNYTNIPLEEWVANKDLWPADKDAKITIYCGSGHRSTIAMTIMNGYGYTNVSSLKGGFGGWARDSYPVVGAPINLDDAFGVFLADMTAYNTIGLDALNEALVENPPFLVDVRTPGEVEEKGHIEGAINISLREIPANLAYLPSFDTPIVTYCGSGWRCTISLTILEAAGWEDVKCLKGGSYSGWVAAGYATVDGLPPAAEMLNAVEVDASVVTMLEGTLANIPANWGGISAEALNTLLVESPDVFVIDARTVGEVEEKGIISAENWTNIPLEEFVTMSELWPADKDAQIVVYCGSGHRSTIAMTLLNAYGYTNVSSLKGGFGSWAADGYPVGIAP